MKEKLKTICEIAIDSLKHEELGGYLKKPVFGSSINDGEKYEKFMSILSQNIIRNIVANDFEITEYEIDNSLVTDNNKSVNNKYISVDVYYTISIFALHKIKKLVLFIDGDGIFFDGGRQEVFDYLEDNYDLLIKQIYKDFYENTKDASRQVSYEELYNRYSDYDMVLFNCDVPSIVYSRNPDFNDLKQIADIKLSKFIDLLKDLYGYNEKLEDGVKVVEACRVDALRLIKKSQTQMIKEDKNKFYLGLWRFVYREYLALATSITNNIKNSTRELKIVFSNEDVQKIEAGLLQSQSIDKVAKLLYTFFHTRKFLQESIKGDKYDFFDLTFIAVSLFKVVEILFNELLNKRWPNLTVKTKRGTIKLGADDLTLGEMNQIFSNNENVVLPQEIKAFLYSKGVRKEELKEVLSRWISKTRNGFLHKDLIEIDNNMIDASIKDSISIICLLMLVLN